MQEIKVQPTKAYVLNASEFMRTENSNNFSYMVHFYWKKYHGCY